MDGSASAPTTPNVYKKGVTLGRESVIAEFHDTSIRTWPANRARSADWAWSADWTSSANRTRSTDRTRSADRSWPADKAGPRTATGAKAQSQAFEERSRTATGAKAQAQAFEKRSRSAAGAEEAPAQTLIWWPWYIGLAPIVS
jgi:hypothetical protein